MLADFAAPAGLAPRASSPDRRGYVAGRWSASELAAIVARLAERGSAALATVPLARRLAVWSEAMEAFLDPESDERRRALVALVATSRLSPEGLCEALLVMLGGAGESAARALAARLPEPSLRSPAAVVLAGNVPALAVQSLLPALLLGRPLLLKSASDEPLFAPALVAALAAREPSLGEAFAALAWRGGDAELEAAAFGGVERVLAYGGGAAIGSLRERIGERLVAHGPRASVALVGRDADLADAARGLARDVALFDQRGCLSVQAVYTDAAPRELAELLACALALEHARLPPGPLDPGLAAEVQQLRGVARMAGDLAGDLALAQGTVVVSRDAEFRPVPGLRTVRVHVVATLDGAIAALRPWRGRLQGAALAGESAVALGDRLRDELGLARVAPAGELQAVEAGWASGGIDPLAALA
ncbi:MAG: acyl-CoA reductase [Thermoanaerobaculia bacterium]